KRRRPGWPAGRSGYRRSLRRRPRCPRESGPCGWVPASVRSVAGESDPTDPLRPWAFASPAQCIRAVVWPSRPPLDAGACGSVTAEVEDPADDEHDRPDDNQPHADRVSDDAEEVWPDKADKKRPQT